MVRPELTHPGFLLRPCALLVLAGILLNRPGMGAEPPVHAGGSDGAGGQPLSAQTSLYSDAQRRRGLQIYLKQCSTCHGERLRGGESAPALMGAGFREHWIGHSVGDLLQKINLMPPKDPGRLSAEEAVSVIAVILAANGFPAGTTDLPSTLSLLQQIRLDSPQSP